MKLADWARQQGIRYKTAHKWFQKGLLPLPAHQLPTGTILVDASPHQGAEQVTLYARVSSADQKADLDRQLGRLSMFAAQHGFHVIKTAKEIGSSLNGQRPHLLRLLQNPVITTIVVEHRDRLARFGSEYIEAALQASGRRVMVVDPTELKDDLVPDVAAVMTSLYARLYGPRAAKKRAQKAVATVLEAQ